MWKEKLREKLANFTQELHGEIVKSGVFSLREPAFSTLGKKAPDGNKKRNSAKRLVPRQDAYFNAPYRRICPQTSLRRGKAH